MTKLVLISGAGRGLGASIAESFVNSGYKVAINYFNSSKEAADLSRKLGDSAQAFKADIRDENEISNMCKEINSHFSSYPDILINNAMTNYVFNGELRKKAEDISWKEIQDHLDVTIKGSLNLIQALTPKMKDKKFGRIINIGTNLVQNPVVPYHDYTIAKGGLLALTRTFAKDLGQFGITVNMVSGGLLKVTDASAATPDEVFEAIAQMTPLQKVTTVQDLADAVVFFASDASRAITGQNLTVDGGLTFN
jgi:3-oxoacyl-[acyl-carrier protein] reductase|tara:strand:+ start:312 stop:1064 length:753 start_codon:yes stop_codon:yes gene_type:complete